MTEPPYVLEVIFSILILALGILWRKWAGSIRTDVIALAKEMKAEKAKNSDQDLKIAVIQANMEHIRTTGDQTAKDVKELLRQNGKRATG